MFRSRILVRIVVALLAASASVYAGDYLVVRFALLHPRPSWPLESITRTRVLAIPQKNGKYDYQIDQLLPVETLTCVHAIFPHFGSQPCWYLKPRANQPIVMN